MRVLTLVDISSKTFQAITLLAKSCENSHVDITKYLIE